MSYEGYNQHLCEKGHRFDESAYVDESKCPCGSPSVWFNAVDDTNYESWGIIVDAVWASEFRLTEEERQTCNLGHEHVTVPATYRAPTEEELERFRSYYTGDGQYVSCREGLR